MNTRTSGWRSEAYAQDYTGQRGSGKKDADKDEFVSRYLPDPPSSVLDAGGGNGKWSLGFSRLGHDVCLIDINPHMLRMAKEILKGTETTIILGDIRFLPFPSDIFHFIFCEADPISQCGSREGALSALKSLHRVLRANCLLVGSLTSRYFWVIKIISEAKSEEDLEGALRLLRTGILKPRDGYLMYLFTPDEFVAEAEKIGFRCAELVPYKGLIASEFAPADLGCEPGITNQIEKELSQEKHRASRYFARRFRFALQKP